MAKRFVVKSVLESMFLSLAHEGRTAENIHFINYRYLTPSNTPDDQALVDYIVKEFGKSGTIFLDPNELEIDDLMITNPVEYWKQQGREEVLAGLRQVPGTSLSETPIPKPATTVITPRNAGVGVGMTTSVNSVAAPASTAQ